MASLNAEAVKFLVIHSSLTPPTQQIGLKELTRKHRMAGKLSIGYHYVINRAGFLENGRPTTQVGQHTPGQNQHSIGICMVGGLDKMGKPEDNYTKEQYTTLKWLLVHLAFQFQSAVVVGHNHFNPSTPCPCFPVGHWLTENSLTNLKPT